MSYKKFTAKKPLPVVEVAFQFLPSAPNLQTLKYELNQLLLFTKLLVLVPTAIIARSLTSIHLKQRTDTFLR